MRKRHLPCTDCVPKAMDTAMPAKGSRFDEFGRLLLQNATDGARLGDNFGETSSSFKKPCAVAGVYQQWYGVHALYLR